MASRGLPVRVNHSAVVSVPGDQVNAPDIDLDLDSLDFAKGGGVVTVVSQDADQGIVLMVAGANREALERTVETGEMHYTSRTRGLWHKGATSGNRQHVGVADGRLRWRRDSRSRAATWAGVSRGHAVVLRGCRARTVRGIGPPANDRPSSSAPRAGSSYTQRLLDDGNLRLKKLGEETAELIMACASATRDARRRGS